jgi:hypothetical protein
VKQYDDKKRAKGLVKRKEVGRGKRKWEKEVGGCPSPS